MQPCINACTCRAYLLDLALLGSQVAPLLLEVPEIRVKVYIRLILLVHHVNSKFKKKSNIQYIPHNFLEMPKSKGSAGTQREIMKRAE